MASTEQPSAGSNALDNLSSLLKQPLTADDAITCYGALEVGVESVAQQPVLSALPIANSKDARYGVSYLRVIRDRLFSLGYLQSKEVISTGVPGPKLKLAIQSFQTDAKLTEDGWVGEKTWQALQQLVSFEEDQNFDHWLDQNGQPTSVLKRAAQLRLYAFGCSDSKPSPKLEFDDSALKQFVSVVQELGLDLSGSLSDSLLDSLWSLRLLFDEDRLVELLGNVDSSIEGQYSTQTQRFLTSIARVELWLLGYKGVKPDGSTKESVAVIQSQGVEADFSDNISVSILRSSGKVDSRTPFYNALCQYFEATQLYPDDKHSEQAAENFLSQFPVFFQHIASQEEADENAVNQQVVNFVQANSDNVEKLDNEAKSLGARLFDGLKRLGRFILKALHFIKDKAEQLLEKLARPFHRMVSMAYKGIQLAVSSVKTGLQMMTGALVQPYGDNQAYGQFSADGDLNLYINIQKDSDDTVCQQLLTRSYTFRLGCQLANQFMSLMASIVKGTLFGWFAFLKACVSAYQSFRNIIDVLVELKCCQV